MKEIINWGEIEKMIDAQRDLTAVKGIRKKLEAIRILARQQEGSLRVVNRAGKYKFLLEQRVGALYRELSDERGSSSSELTNKQAVTEEVGASRQTLNSWVKESSVPKEIVERYEAECNDAGKEFTSLGAWKYHLDEKRRERFADGKPAEWPKGKYRVIYADPPWLYSKSQDNGNGLQTEHSMSHYPMMKASEIAALPVGDLALDSSVLWLWSTSPKIEEAIDVLNCWGFEYKSMFVWHKMAHNVGHYNSVRHELLLIATRGSCLPAVGVRSIPSVIEIPRTEHSVKPREFREMIDEMYPDGPRIELFGREQVDGWDLWGNGI